MNHDHDHDIEQSAFSAEMLDLDGDVLRTYWADAISWLRQLAGGMPRGRILDLGAGSGVGALCLAQRFEGSTVLAVDGSAALLSRLRDKAFDHGLAARIDTLLADLDGDWPDVGTIDITWASMSLHHFADPDRVLRQILAATRPGGLLAVAEFDEPLRFLPDDLGIGRPGFEQRCQQAAAAEHAHALPDLGSDWSARVKAAGFDVVTARDFAIDVRPGAGFGAARYATASFGRLRQGLAARLDADDQQTLDRLLDGDDASALHRREDIHIRGTRTVTIARRP